MLYDKRLQELNYLMPSELVRKMRKQCKNCPPVIKSATFAFTVQCSHNIYFFL